MIHTASKTLKSLLLLTALAASALAFALPSPKDIEAAVSQGQLTQAESMLREVIGAKPQSAKAHYELGQVLLREHRNKEAHTELLAAKAIDPGLKFATSPQQFETILAQANALPAHSNSASQAITPASTHSGAPTGGGFSLSDVWIGIAALGVIALLIRSRRPAPAPYAAPAPDMNAGPGTAFGRNPAYAPSYPAAGYPQAAPSNGSTMTGAVVGGLAGVAAGYALSKALEGDHHSAAAAPSSNSWGDNQGLVSVDEPAPPAFDAGAGGNDWGDDSGSSDDNW
ncbi:MAG: tetratricopeptide repeat protein [Limnohabitans sp.]